MAHSVNATPSPEHAQLHSVRRTCADKPVHNANHVKLHTMESKLIDCCTPHAPVCKRLQCHTRLLRFVSKRP